MSTLECITEGVTLPLFSTLFSKTFLILGFQLLITFIGARAALAFIRKLYNEGAAGVAASRTDFGDVDINIGWEFVGPYFFGLLILDILLFLLLMFYGIDNLKIGVPVFFAWSALAGAQVALALITVDEDLGARVLAITVLIALLAAVAGMYSGIDYSAAGKFLFYGLSGLIIFGIARQFMHIRRAAQRVFAFFGVMVFTGYLIFDFNHLHRLGRASVNDWHSAMSVSISLYLDVINLFFDLLDTLSR